MLTGVTAYAAEDAEGAAAAVQPSSTGGAAVLAKESEDGCIVLTGHGGSVVLSGCTAGHEGGVLVRTIPDAGTGAGFEVLLKDMRGVGDILHEDLDCPLQLVLESAELTGRVTGAVNGLPLESEPLAGEEAEETGNVGKPSDKEESWGVRMTMDGDSVWTVTGECQLYSFSLAEGAKVRAGDGMSLAIYVDCAMDNAAAAYDAATGSRIRAFVPGVEYTGVVIRPVEESEADGGDIFAALGIGTAVVDGEYSVSVVELLEALGVQVRVDETTGDIIVDDPDSLLNALIDGENE